MTGIIGLFCCGIVLGPIAIITGKQATAEADRCAAKPPIASLFEDVYADVPWHLREQQELLEAELRKHGPRKSLHDKD